MKVLVTGASGFIGGAFLRRFALREGVTLYGVGRRARCDFPPSVRYRALALDCLDALDFRPDVVIHAAGRASPWGTAREYYRDNVETTVQVLEFCSRNSFPRLIFLSSAAVYYRFADRFALRESEVIGPAFTSEYGRSKYLAEQYVAQYAGEKTILRPCAVFGDGDQLLLPPLLAAARKNQLVNLQRPGRAQSEMIHIDMLCDYLMLAAVHPRLRPCYNISAAHPLDTQRLLGEVLRELDLPRPQRTMSLTTALRIAGALEWLWRILPLPGEPPITRFGVGVFGYSATLDVSLMLADFGPPTVPFSASLSHFLQRHKVQQP